MGILKLASFQWLMCRWLLFHFGHVYGGNVESCEICACMAISRGSSPRLVP
jgi:hypothetical protein